MPVKVRRVGNRWRIVETATGKIARNAAGTSIDGGGHATSDAARKQAAAVNIEQRKNRCSN